MALGTSRKIALLERWIKILYSNYLRYGVENALMWRETASFEAKRLVDVCYAEQQALFTRMVQKMDQLGGVTPPLGYAEDVAYLNYVHLPVLIQRSVGRMNATLQPFEAELELLEQSGEFELYDLGEAYIELVKSQCQRLVPLCANESQLSPA
jgi:hypothetical protein